MRACKIVSNHYNICPHVFLKTLSKYRPLHPSQLSQHLLAPHYRQAYTGLRPLLFIESELLPPWTTVIVRARPTSKPSKYGLLSQLSTKPKLCTPLLAIHIEVNLKQRRGKKGLWIRKAGRVTLPELRLLFLTTKTDLKD